MSDWNQAKIKVHRPSFSNKNHSYTFIHSMTADIFFYQPLLFIFNKSYNLLNHIFQVLLVIMIFKNNLLTNEIRPNLAKAREVSCRAYWRIFKRKDFKKYKLCDTLLVANHCKNLSLRITVPFLEVLLLSGNTFFSFIKNYVRSLTFKTALSI